METRKTGYTLIELLAGILISAVVLASLYSVFTSSALGLQRPGAGLGNDPEHSRRAGPHDAEIRLAGYKNSVSTFNGIQTAGPSTIRIVADLNQDGDTLDTDEDIAYTFNSGTLQICRNGVSLPIAR